MYLFKLTAMLLNILWLLLKSRRKTCCFFSKTINKSEKVYSVVQKEALAIMEAVRRRSHYFCGKCFDLVTDHRALSFMVNKRSKSEVKNWKIQL